MTKRRSRERPRRESGEAPAHKFKPLPVIIGTGESARGAIKGACTCGWTTDGAFIDKSVARGVWDAHHRPHD